MIDAERFCLLHGPYRIPDQFEDPTGCEVLEEQGKFGEGESSR
jgi:hypothetical protein